MRVFLVTAVAAASLVGAAPSWADDEGVAATLHAVNADVEQDDVVVPGVDLAADDQEVVLEPMCSFGDAPGCDFTCEVDGVLGMLYEVWVDGERSGTHCQVLGSGDDETITPGRMLSEFQRLEWPKSELIIQPPDGKTLVNFETNFLTENTAPHRQVVTLLGQQVEIEAAPSSYIWDSGDGDQRETDTPGARHPDLLVTHKYLRKTAYRPRVDTVYTGRYRVNGGPWVQIPQTLTVTGDPRRLDVIGARPILVAPDG